MEITEGQLLALARRVDEMHHEAMKTSMGAAGVTIGGAVVALQATPTLAADGDIAAFAASVENTLVAVYGIGAKKLSGVVLTLVQTFAKHHQEPAPHADKFPHAGKVGFRLFTVRLPILESCAAQIQRHAHAGKPFGFLLFTDGRLTDGTRQEYGAFFRP